MISSMWSSWTCALARREWLVCVIWYLLMFVLKFSSSDSLQERRWSRWAERNFELRDCSNNYRVFEFILCKDEKNWVTSQHLFRTVLACLFEWLEYVRFLQQRLELLRHDWISTDIDSCELKINYTTCCSRWFLSLRDCLRVFITSIWWRRAKM